MNGPNTGAAIEIPSDATSEPDTLSGLLEDVLRDQSVARMMRVEGVDEADAMRGAKAILSEGTFDVASKMEELTTAEHHRDTALGAQVSSEVALGLTLIAGLIGFLVLGVVGAEKLSGHLSRLVLWPFVAVPSVVFAAGVIWAFVADARRKSKDLETKTQATIEAERLRRSLRDQLRSLAVTPAIERASPPKFRGPSADVVCLTDAPSLSSRVESDGRIETTSYREVLTNLGRTGGATIGLAGSRGVGKSELLRAFCEDVNNRTSIETAGIIGISVPAPVVYEAEPFLRVIIRRLAEVVPDYSDAEIGRPRISSGGGLLAAVAAAVVVGGAVLITGVTPDSRLALGIVFIVVGMLGAVWAFVKLAEPYLFVNPVGRSVRKGPRRSRDPAIAGPRIAQARRRAAARTATNVAQRVRYVETRSVQSQGSLSWHGVGLTHTSGISLDQLPLTEPDLVRELDKLVTALCEGGYGVRIGIDELDKLVVGDDAEKFLTGIKVLFPIRNCSFVLTISENASAQFARRGMPIRDVFDSSLDAVVTVQPLTFSEARRLVRARLSTGPSEQTISDTQVLLCHCLAGGLPREFLRFCRQLGEVNARMDHQHTLDVVMAALLSAEMRSRIDGMGSALHGRDPSDDSATFLAELESIGHAIATDTGLTVLEDFLQSDESFAALCRPPKAQRPVGSASQAAPATDLEWICDARRQVYSYLHFSETVREAFGPKTWLQQAEHDAPGLIAAFELLSDARRQMESDAAAGWRRTVEARTELGLAAIALPEHPT
jgi:hypothetical protein